MKNIQTKTQAELDAPQDVFEGIGYLNALNYNTARNKLKKYDIFWQVKKDKKQNKAGMTWAQFCTAAGENVRTINRFLSVDRSVLESKVDQALKKLFPLKDNQMGGDDD